MFALNRLGLEATVTDDVEELKSADKVLFPGQGEASSAMRYLRERNLDQLIMSMKQPFLGICLGMQLMCAHSEENDTDCLDILPVKVRKFDQTLKVPHMGWNSLKDLKGDLFKGVNEGEFLYFVHSYYVEQSEYSIACSDYGIAFSAALQKDNFYAIQAHPEKSAGTGLKILENFLSI
jgi:glutamine amidotransferase